MVDRLPEEILREILKPLFHVSPEHFREQPSSFLRTRPSFPRSPSVLLVCKRWLRVATPLFYECLQIKSDKAVEGLAETLLATPALGQYIRRLRLEGGYGRNLLTVVKHAPDIRVLSIQLDVMSRSVTSGLSRSLLLLNPEELHLHGLGGRRPNQKTEALLGKVVSALGTWKNLVSMKLRRLPILFMSTLC